VTTARREQLTTNAGGEGAPDSWGEHAPACPECGAATPDGAACSDLLHDLLERVYTLDAAAHGLAVACYMLQHPGQQEDDALQWAHFHLTLAVRHGLPLGEARRLARARFDQRRFRTAGRLVRAALRRVEWRMTIDGLELSSSPGAAPVLRWAGAILDDIDAAASRPRRRRRG
jgi:hypothetical protein